MAVKIKGLTKKFKGVTALNGVSLDIAQGQLVALLGENGAGKTTLIKILCSILGFDSGEIEIFGLELEKNRAEIKKLIALSPQETAVVSSLTVLENLQFICDLFGVTEGIEDVIKSLGLEEVKNQRAKTLSGGFKRRLSIAMALVTKPKLLFLDEPTLALDVSVRRELWNFIKGLKGKITIVLTTHYIEEAEALADKIYVLKKGNVITGGTAQEILESTNKNSLEDAFLALIGGEA